MKRIFSILCCYFIVCCNSCSMLTHIEVAKRAQSYFSFNGFEQLKPMIEKHLGTYQAGAVFPDWGYWPEWRDNVEASELAHWPPFYLAAAEYFQQTYKQPYSDEAEILLVFLAGATTHMVSDVAWHSLLNVSQGFIVSMSCFGWNCDYDSAHGTADLGGDSVLAAQNDLSYISTNWSIPISDIAEIYKYQGWKNVTQRDLTRGMNLLFLGTMGLSGGVAEILYPEENKIPGFLQDQFEGYFIGGLDDMAIWTTYCWPYILGWFVDGPGPSPSICRIMSPGMPTNSTQASLHVPEWRFLQFPDELNKAGAKVTKETEISKKGDNVEFYWYGESAYPTKASPNAGPQENRTTIYAQNDYAYLGYDVLAVDLNQDKLVDLIVSAPGYSNATLAKPQMGCVYFIFGTSNISLPQFVDIESIADYKFCGDSSHDRFGHSLAVLDFNRDGVLDVAISSPTTNSDHLVYEVGNLKIYTKNTIEGKVNVFFGAQTGSLWQAKSATNITLLGAFYSNFGFELITGDVNLDGYDDLIVGSPFAPRLKANETGNVAIYFSSPLHTAGQNLTTAQADIFLTAPMQLSMGVDDHGWWGSTLLYVPRSYGYKFPYLIVGGARNIWFNCSDFLPECGSFSIYVLDGEHYNQSLALFYGNEFERVGAQLALGYMPDLDKTSPILSVSIPLSNTTVPQAGKVVFLSFNAILSFISAWSANSSSWIIPFGELMPLVSTSINGNQEFARFGSSVAFVDFVEANNPPKDTIFIGYPLWSSNFTEEGCVCMWASGDFPRGSIDNPISSASRVYTGSIPTTGLEMEKAARFGNAMSFGDFDGDGNTDIFIGSSRKSVLSYLGGALDVILSS
eukprot:Phypoly_transcript_02552.p1 GENE.Phypoly_transcript_02552~~Phypoly_transcript_02552.p1  ORF type:complete len:849 (+),score=79.56 Phypoly_transcript_02552:187-2733(+)